MTSVIVNPNNIEKIVENFNGRDIQFMSDDNLKEDIKSCINKLERDNSAHNIELNETHTSHQESVALFINGQAVDGLGGPQPIDAIATMLQKDPVVHYRLALWKKSYQFVKKERT